MFIDPASRAAQRPSVSTPAPLTTRGWLGSCAAHAVVILALALLMERAVTTTPPVPLPTVPLVFATAEAPPVPATTEPPPAAPSPPPEAAEPPPPPEAVAPPPPPEAVAPPPPPEAVAPPPPVTAAVPPKPRPAVRHPAHTVARAAPTPPVTQAAPAVPAAPSAPQVAALSAPLIPPRPLAAAAGNRAPAYPESARRRRESGRVMLRVAVSAEGRATEVAVAESSGSAVLDAAAADAVRSWRFVPATRGGLTVAGVADVPIRFNLSE